MKVYATCQLLAKFVHGQKINGSALLINLPNLEFSENFSQTLIYIHFQYPQM